MTAVTNTLRAQIKTRQRVRDLAEVFTHEREVTAMLDLIPAGGRTGRRRDLDVTFLEPSCGSGNFLEEIVRRKVAGIRWATIRSAARYEHTLLRAIASVYGVDICPDNVTESRSRVMDVLRSHYYNDANTITPSEGFARAAETIVGTNILCANFLTDATTTEVVAYKPGRSGTFTRTWSMLDESGSLRDQPDLFTTVREVRTDERPVHYTELADNPNPVLHKPDGTTKGA